MTIFSNFSILLLALNAAGLVTVYALTAWGVGRLFNWGIESRPGVVPTFVLGHAALAIVLQLVAVAGLFRWHVIIALFAVLVTISLLLVPLRLRRLDVSQVFPRALLSRVLACGVMVLLLFLLADSFSLPGTDALAYYMAQPKLMAVTGSYTLLANYESFGVLPAIAEMPYAVMYLVGGDTLGFVAAKFSMWPVLLATLALLWQSARAVKATTDSAWVFMAFAITSSAVTLVAWDGKTDLVGLMYFLAALLYMPRLLAPSLIRREIFFFGFLAGCAVMAKLSYALILPFVLGIPLVGFWWKEPKKLLIIVLIAAGAVVCAFIFGWWLKNAVLFGDPFAPILRLREATPKFDVDQVWFSAEFTRWIVKTYPFAITFGKYPMQHGGVSPMWLMLIPALLMKPWQSEGGRKALWLAAGSLSGLCVWVLLRPSVIAPRYFLPALLVPGLVLILGYQLWVEKKPTLARITALALCLLLVFNIQSARFVFLHFTAPLVGALKGNSSALPLLSRTRYLASDPRKSVKVLLLSYSSEVLPGRMLTSFHTLSELEKGEGIWAFVLRKKIDFIVYDPFTHKQAELEAAPPAGLSVKPMIFATGVYSLYVITRSPDAP